MTDKKKSKVADKTVYKSMDFSGCGVTSNPCAVDVKDGRVVRVRPIHYDRYYTKEDLNYWVLDVDGHKLEAGMKSFPPPISLARKQRAYSKNRVPYPLKRVDWDPKGERNPQNRGISKFERISWDEAIELVASEINRVKETYGMHSILCQGDGHMEAKVWAGAHGNHTMMLREAGGTAFMQRNPDSWEGWYWGAKHVWGMFGSGQQSNLMNLVPDIAKNSDAILLWGGDPETTPWGWGGQVASRVLYFWEDCGVESVFISPDCNYTNAVHRGKWIPVLPNTDAALQLGIAYVWMTEGLYDVDYIATHTDGFDWFQYYVLGHEDGVAKTPEWAEAKCGVPAYTIKALARYWAKRDVSIVHVNGGSFIRAAFSHEPGRLEVYLLAMQAWGKPGRNQMKMIEWGGFGDSKVYPLPKSEFYPITAPAYHGWDQTCGDCYIPKTKIHEAIIEGKCEWHSDMMLPLPASNQVLTRSFPKEGEERLHMIWCDSPCFSTCWNGGNKYQDALRHESIETVVIQHPWLENDTLMADIILPVSTVFECDDFATGDPTQFGMFYLGPRAIEPVVESRTDYEIACDVARALEKYGDVFEGIVERYVDKRTYEEGVREAFESQGIPENYGCSWEQVKEQGFWMCRTSDDWDQVAPGMFDFYNDPDNNPLDTDTGKIEFYSSLLAEWLPDDKERGPVAHWVEESDEHKDRLTSDRAKDYPYLLVTNHPRWRVHAQFDDCNWLREIETCKVIGPDGYGYEPLWVNPVDARELGLSDGDVAGIFNERGMVLGGVRITERIMPRSVYQDHGARVDPIVMGTGGVDRGGANNLIAPSATSSKNAPGEVTGGYLVGVKKVDVFELAKQYPEAFEREFDPEIGLIVNSFIVKEGE